MPKNIEKLDNTPSQTLQFYNDFLVVHPYNLKNMSGRHRTFTENKRNIHDNLQLNMYMTEQERKQFNSDGHVPSNRKSYRTNPLGGARHIFGGGGGGATVGEMKPDEFELNHIFLINKRKNVSRDF